MYTAFHLNTKSSFFFVAKKDNTKVLLNDFKTKIITIYVQK